ncbi:hypothetical protein EDB80DRAFT_703926 [Ilyonectria destructans]|nr:hypothetical protein EDB80DRAFT_703926 [Ilyonectria destructans]
MMAQIGQNHPAAEQSHYGAGRLLLKPELGSPRFEDKYSVDQIIGRIFSNDSGLENSCGGRIQRGWKPPSNFDCSLHTSFGNLHLINTCFHRRPIITFQPHIVNMFSLRTLVAVAAALVGSTEALPSLLQSRDSWGGAVSLGPTTSTIVKAVTTIIPGKAPTTQNDMLFLWPGMSNGTGDLVQTTLESWPDNSWCGAKSGQWCIRASLFGSFGQLDGTASPVSGDQKVKIDYTLLSDKDTWQQTVTDADTGAALSSFSYKSGPYMRGYGTGTECNGGCSPTVAEQRYINTVITLAGADTNFGKTISTSQGATYTGLTSSQGGKVWTISEIRVPAMV